MIAHRLGLPIERFVAATNVNDAVPVFLETGHYEPRESIRTVANAMDVGAPSNFERITSLYGNDLDALRRDLTGVAYTDEQIVRAIGDVHARHGYLLDPHGAVGWLAINDALTTAPQDAIGVFLATAHPAKFLETWSRPPARRCRCRRRSPTRSARPRHSIPMDADYAALSRAAALVVRRVLRTPLALRPTVGHLAPRCRAPVVRMPTTDS